MTTAAIAETKRLRPLVIEGDFFVLTNLDTFGRFNLSSASTSWAAWQWATGCNHSVGSSVVREERGAVMVFRRLKASASTTVSLNCVDPSAHFELRYYENNYKLTKTEMRSGIELTQLRVEVTLPEAPQGGDLKTVPDAGSGSMLIEYSRAQHV